LAAWEHGAWGKHAPGVSVRFAEPPLAAVLVPNEALGRLQIAIDCGASVLDKRVRSVVQDGREW